jgi:hypothetical protein
VLLVSFVRAQARGPEARLVAALAVERDRRVAARWPHARIRPFIGNLRKKLIGANITAKVG